MPAIMAIDETDTCDICHRPRQPDQTDDLFVVTLDWLPVPLLVCICADCRAPEGLAA